MALPAAIEAPAAQIAVRCQGRGVAAASADIGPTLFCIALTYPLFAKLAFCTLAAKPMVFLHGHRSFFTGTHVHKAIHGMNYSYLCHYVFMCEC